jgi:hypothetical protein
MVMPPTWPEAQVNRNRHQFQRQWQFDAPHQPVWGREEDSHNFITPENSLLSYDSSANSGTIQFFFFIPSIFCNTISLSLLVLLSYDCKRNFKCKIMLKINELLHLE